MIAIVTNIDNDHLGTHGGDFDALKRELRRASCTTCRSMASRCCASDDEHVQRILPRVGRPVVTYGCRRRRGRARGQRAARAARARCSSVLRAAAAHAGGDAQHARPAQRAATRWRRSPWRPSSTSTMPPSSARSADLPGHRAAPAAAGRSATARRQRSRLSMTTVIIRPRSPRRSMRCARPGRARRLVLAFQPHRYTRTRDLLDDFAAC